MGEVPHDERRWEFVLAAAVRIRDGLGGHGRVLSQVLIDLPAAPGPVAPDLVVIAPGAVHNARGRYTAADVRAVLELSGPGQAEAGRVYAHSGVPLYVVVDPVGAACTVHTAPSPEGVYHEAERVPFGNDLFLPLGERTLVLETEDFPRTKPTPGTA
ncbi:Uma2 family endonuclease [Kitasatospora sp. NPDC051170]|uniref:Uma2 family endonuclease n=1 Tax=Kitasatospora sp. NPDC051170 TaxID=3364056 RepID=UPI0037A1D4B1